MSPVNVIICPHGTSTYITLRMFYPNQITLVEERVLKIWMKHPDQLVRSFSDRHNSRNHARMNFRSGSRRKIKKVNLFECHICLHLSVPICST